MNAQTLLYEGKAKKIFAAENPREVVVYYKDDATANNAEKKGTIANKGVMNNAIASLLFEKLEQHGIPTHYIKKISEREQLCKKLTIIPLEVIVRNLIAGSMARRVGLPEGTEIPNTIVEICYKDDSLGDPLINDHHAVAMGIATYEELAELYKRTLALNKLLQDVFAKENIILVDFKVEYGKDADGNILLADEITPDTCRLWDATTKQKLDKDRFRRDLGGVEQAYAEILARLGRSA